MRRAALVAIALLAGCSRPTPPAPGEGVAAVAFRDAVPGWQRVGTRGFSRHYLDAAYDHVSYLEADALGADAHAALRDALEQELRGNRAVDLFLLVNSGREVEVVAELPSDLRARLRLVYNTGAGGGWQQEAWRSLGVRAYVSHPGSANLAPFFYVDFLREWVDGHPLDECVFDANTSMHARLSGFSAPLVLAASGFHARAEDLPYWEEATRASIAGDGIFALRDR